MKSYNKFAISYLVIICVVTVLMCLVVRLITKVQCPAQLYSVPLFFAFMLAVLSLMRYLMMRRNKPAQTFIMAYRPVKMLLQLAFLLTYMLVVRESLFLFVVVFAVFYLVLLFYETRFFMKNGVFGA